jgi:hypothetical protein
MSVKTVIGQVCVQQQKSLLNLGGMSIELGTRIVQSAPNLEEIGIKILEIGNFNINFSAEDQTLLREANRARGEARRNIGIAEDATRAKQFELDQKFQQDARYVQQLAGTWQSYAAGQAVMGAGEGMAHGGAGVGVAALGAQIAAGVGIAQAMNPAAAQGQPPPAPSRADIGAPGAPQHGHPVGPFPSPAAAPTVEQRLERLAELKNKGLITEEEFSARRAKILDEI